MFGIKLSQVSLNLIYELKAGCVKDIFLNADRAIGYAPKGVVNFGFYAVNPGFSRMLEHNAKRYSLFIDRKSTRLNSSH